MSKVNSIVEQQILRKLEEGIVPWQRGWNTKGSPRNIISDKEYNGINRLFTSMMGYSSPYWGSYKQMKELGGQVRKGEKGTQIIWASQVQKKNPKEGEKEFYSAFRYSAVFNLDQCDDVKVPKKIQLHMDKFKNRDMVEIDNSLYETLHGYIEREKGLKLTTGKPSYAPKRDTISMPEQTDFFGIGEYLNTFSHEIVHSTGHWLRLDRFKEDAPVYNGSDSYAIEELVAEIGSAFLCAELGIEKILDNQISYISGWKETIKNNEGIVVKASSMAQKAVNLIRGEKE